MKTLVVVLLLALVGCGEVTEVPDQLVADGGASDGAAETHTAGSPDSGPGRDAVDHDTVSTPEASPPPTTCTVADGCAACTQDSAAGAGLQSAGQCRQLIACVRAGGQGDFPWASCANLWGAAGAAGGLACAQQIDKACP